ncbi:MAG: class I SAM-dependent methyltransferase [Chloroflexus sp.]|nr:class I SAM-dependent methyltransferase [Chloroflexus sp.]
MITLYQRLIRWLFQRLYHELAWSYDLIAWLVSGGYWQRWVVAAVPALRGRVLELGCGPGYLQRALAARPGVVGLDASPAMLRRAARFTKRLVRADARRLPFAGASFDTVCATFPAEYILDPATHAEIRRVLAPDGQLVIVDGGRLEGGYGRLIDLIYRLIWLGRHTRELPATIPFGDVRMQVQRITVGHSSVLIMTGRPHESGSER